MEPFYIVWAVGTLMAVPPWGNIGGEAGVITQICGLIILVLSFFM